MKIIERIRMIRNCRFSAERRMRYHNQMYIWTMTFTSLFLIIIPLIDALHVKSLLGYSLQNPSMENSQFIQISLGIIVLVLSQVISSQNFMLRGDYFHRCGIALDELLSKAESMAIKGPLNHTQTQNIIDEYHLILSTCENHCMADFICARFESHKTEFENLQNSWDKVLKSLFLIYIYASWFVRFSLGFAPYAVILVLQIVGFKALYF